MPVRAKEPTSASAPEHSDRRAPLPARIQGIDQIWVINLDRCKDRLERFMQRHPEMSGRINRLSAYDGQSLELTPALARLFAPNDFDWHKPTMGCALSHLSLWHKLAGEADENASYLILEDEALLDPSWVATAEKVFFTNSVPADWEALFLGGILPKYRETFEKNIQPLNRMVARVNPECVFGSNPRGYFHFCAYAYLLNKRGAQRLLDLVEGGNGFWMQADFFVCYTTPELSSPRPVYFFHPLLAQSFQDTAKGLVQPYDENSLPSDKVDSDIWKDSDKFTAEEVARSQDINLPLDIPAALGGKDHHSPEAAVAADEQRGAPADTVPEAPEASGTGASKEIPSQSANIHEHKSPAIESDGETVPQNLGHMVLEGHLGGFFSEGDGGTYYPLMWTHLVRKYGIRSVLDVGCGRGYSALYFQSLGCKITGIDGSEEAAATQLIGNDFVRADYSVGPSGLAEGYDLVWSCEFVEHVEEKFMANYLQDFRKGNYLAMTFAGPGQPGHHHVNCRPAEYWIRRLYAWGFDFLPEETTELREKARQDMEKNDSESDKRFVYHFMSRGLFFKNTRNCSGGL